LNQIVIFDEIRLVGDAIQGDLDAIIFNPIVSTIFKIAENQNCELDARFSAFLSIGLRPFSLLGYHDCITYDL
jgi:hypothetical protein